MKQVLASLTSLTTLGLDIMSDLEEMVEVLTAQILSTLAPLTALTTLNLNQHTCSPFLGDKLSALAPLNALTSLDLGRSVVTDGTLRALAPLTGLTSLHMFQCEKDWDDNLVVYQRDETAEGFKTLALLTGLTDLDLFPCCSPVAVTEESLKATLAPLTGLTRLNLRGCEIGSLTKQGLAVAVDPLTRLSTLLPPALKVYANSNAIFEDD
jgi:hypothetical protein